jgi:hypothetical protein
MPAFAGRTLFSSNPILTPRVGSAFSDLGDKLSYVGSYEWDRGIRSSYEFTLCRNAQKPAATELRCHQSSCVSRPFSERAGLLCHSSRQSRR